MVIAGCEISPVALDCGPDQPGVTYEWDWDGDTTVDDSGCAVSPTPRSRCVLGDDHGDDHGGMRGKLLPSRSR